MAHDTRPRGPGEPAAPLWERFVTWPMAWKVVAVFLGWPFLLASWLWSSPPVTTPTRAGAVAVAAVFGAPWILVLAVLLAAGLPTTDDGTAEFPDEFLGPVEDLFAPLDDPVESPPR